MPCRYDVFLGSDTMKVRLANWNVNGKRKVDDI
jgi:hypothetical protein